MTLSANIEKNINGCINSSIMCAAVYNGQQMEKLTLSAPMTVLPTDELQAFSFDETLNLPENLTDRTVKLFLWKDFETLEPHTSEILIQ